MKRLLKSPVFNAVCISIFTLFYALIFIVFSSHSGFTTHYEGDSPFWKAWSGFLLAQNQVVLSWVLIGITVLLVILLIIRRRPYDEYHASILTYCLAVAAVLTLAAIAIFFLVTLNETIWIKEKFILFIIVHWITIVFSNLVYVILCRWRG